MEGISRKRYPGAQPFSDDELSRELFFGREQESVALTNQILANRLVVLFARSGLGKTSLINAGVAESLRGEGFLPLTVRVARGDLDPVESIYRGIAEACRLQAIEYIEGDRSSLWYFFKTAEFWQDDYLFTPVLIIDQFEELFTLQSEQKRNDFLDQFSYLARGVRPKEPVIDVSRVDGSRISVSELPPSLKIVLSLREDFLACLEELSNRIPEVLAQRFRLLPLSRVAAAMAMESPASVENSVFVARPFEIEPSAKNAVLDFLENRAIEGCIVSSSYIEPFQLQLICQRIEEIAENKQRVSGQGVTKVTGTEIGKEKVLRKILKDFYKRKVKNVPSLFQRIGVRRLCSEHLISPYGRRLRMEESEIKRITGVKSKTLNALIENRLLRVDRSQEGNFYELSHDSLIKPIMGSRKVWFVIKAISLMIVVLLGIILSLITAMFLSYSFLLESIPRIVILVAIVSALILIYIHWARQSFREFRAMLSRSRI